MSRLEGVEVGEMDESQAVVLFFKLSTLNDRLQGTWLISTMIAGSATIRDIAYR
jgi:hypothetical protein